MLPSEGDRGPFQIISTCCKMGDDKNVSAEYTKSESERSMYITLKFDEIS